MLELKGEKNEKRGKKRAICVVGGGGILLRKGERE